MGSKVVKVPLERYVRGVISAEMPSSWPMAALEAQAIASRTYALTSDAGGSRFDVYSDTRSQMYLGVAAETAATNSAVAATAGQVVLYQGKPAATYFFSSSGGMTENIENSFIGSSPEPWLKGVVDQYEEPAVYRWKTKVTFTAAAAQLSGLFKGSFKGIEVLTRGVSPRIVTANVLGSRGSSTISGPELASLLGLQSTWAYFSVSNGKRVTREPDRSHLQKAASPTAPAPAAPAAGDADGRPGGLRAHRGRDRRRRHRRLERRLRARQESSAAARTLVRRRGARPPPRRYCSHANPPALRRPHRPDSAPPCSSRRPVPRPPARSAPPNRSRGCAAPRRAS